MTNASGSTKRALKRLPIKGSLCVDFALALIPSPTEGQGTDGASRWWTRDLSCAFGRISNANAYIETARVYIEMPQGIISIQAPLISRLRRQLPHPRGKPFGGADSDYPAFPWGKGDREERAVDEGCFRLTLASQLCCTNDASCIQTWICLAGAVIRCWLIAVPRLSRRGRRTPRNLHAFLVVLAGSRCSPVRAS